MADLFKLLASLTSAPGDSGSGNAGGVQAPGTAQPNGQAGGPVNGSSGNGGALSFSAAPGTSAAAAVQITEEDAAAGGRDAAAGGCGCDDGGAAVGTRITIPGFYDGVRPKLIDLAWAGLEECDEFSMDSYQCVLGLWGGG